MYRIIPSETARSEIDALSLERRRELAAITFHIEQYFPALIAADIIERFRWWRLEGYRYWDGSFPYMLYFTFPKGEREGAELHLHLMLRASTAPPRR